MLGSIFGVMVGGWVFISEHKHLLITLISLEMIALGLSWMFGVCFSYNLGESYVILVFLSMAACEGSLGLALLICMVRSHGSDKLNNMSVLEC